LQPPDRFVCFFKYLTDRDRQNFGLWSVHQRAPVSPSTPMKSSARWISFRHRTAKCRRELAPTVSSRTNRLVCRRRQRPFVKE
jgi:hypothetical protein